MKPFNTITIRPILYISLVFIFLLLPGNIIHAETRIYDVTNYGANGYDTVSDVDAIQALLDMATETDMTVINIPDGTYYLDDTLFIHSNTTLQLSPNAVIYRMTAEYDGALLLNTDWEYYANSVGGYDLSHDITITGGTWDGGDLEEADAVGDLIYIGHARNITIQNATIKNCYGSHAIEYAGVKDSAIRNCTITGFRYRPDKFTAEAIQLDVCYKDGSGIWTPGFILDKTTCKNIVIEKNTIIDYPRGIGVHHTLKGYEVSNLTIRNNTIKRSSAANQGKCVLGLFLLGAKNSSVTNNTFKRYSYGAIIKQCSGITLKKNTFYYNSTRTLSIEGCNKNNGTHAFVVTKDDIGTKKLSFNCGMIKSGTVKTMGKTYKFKAKKKKATINLKKKIKAGKTVKFYGKDKYKNKYYRTYTIPK